MTPLIVCVHSKGHERESTMVATGYQFGRCLASQMGRSLVYDCEYLGSVDRLAFTPVTERAFLSVTSAISAFHCALITGAAGLGKSQTVTDLAVVGIQTVLFFLYSFALFFSFMCIYQCFNTVI